MKIKVMKIDLPAIAGEVDAGLYDYAEISITRRDGKVITGWLTEVSDIGEADIRLDEKSKLIA